MFLGKNDLFKLYGFVSCSPESCKVSVILINCSQFSLQDMIKAQLFYAYNKLFSKTLCFPPKLCIS